MAFPKMFTATILRNLSHVDHKGKASMVNILTKSSSTRTAVASGRITVGPKIFQLIEQNSIKKGDVLTVARIAGIQAAKQTGHLIPLCHPISLEGISVTCQLEQDNRNSILVESEVQCTGKTGVEMEALVAVSIALTTIYDMCKSVSKDMKITDIHLVSKRGGKSDYLEQ